MGSAPPPRPDDPDADDRSIAALRRRREREAQGESTTPSGSFLAVAPTASAKGAPRGEAPPTLAASNAGNRSDWLTMLSVAVIGALAVIVTWGGVGWSWDEAYYLPPAQLALDWVKDGAPRSPEAYDVYWREINELPSVCKWLWAFSLATVEPLLGPIVAMRLPVALAFGALLALLYAFLRNDLGRDTALLGVTLYALMPRVFGHAHIAATETVTTLVMLAVTHAFRRGCDDTLWALAAGLLFGVAIATKINAFFLFPALVLWGVCFRPDRALRPVAAMVFLSAPVMVALWPWLWHDSQLRILDYLKFHAGHQDTAVWYMGRKWGYGQPNAPWHYPFVMLAVTLPLLHLTGLVLGVARAAVCWRRPFVALLAIQAFWPLLLIATPGLPKYDGVRLFLPAMPYLAGLMALGIDGVVRALANTPEHHGFIRRPLLVGLIMLSVGVLGIRDFWRAHPMYLSYFNPLVGGLPGAWERGFEVTYWGERLNGEVLDWLNDPKNIPDGASIKTRGFFARSLEQHQTWENLRPALLIDKLPEGKTAFDFHLIQARRGFWGEVDWLLFEHAPKARAIFAHQGVPMFFVYGPLEEYAPQAPASGEAVAAPTP